jgi:GNAT superfamily N-acetyltransferase
VHWRRHGRGRFVRGCPLIVKDIEIRTARREELSLLPPLLLQAAWRYRHAGFAEIAGHVERDPIPLSVLNSAWEGGLVHVAARLDGPPFGFIASSERDAFLHVMELHVLPEQGRGGLGGLLLQEHASIAAVSGSPGVTLACFRSIPWQMPFYAKHGFVEYPRVDWTPRHHKSWDAQERFGLDMDDRTFLIRDVSHGYAIRTAIASDLSSLAQIEFEAGQRFAAAGMPEIAAMTRADLFPQDLARRLTAEGSLWVAAHNERPVGFAAAEATDGYGFVYELDVLPEHAGQKLGWSLINAAESWARGKGLKGLTLATFRDIPWNAPYYARMGFKEWPRHTLTPGHEASWKSQSRSLDMTRRLFMIKSFES